MAELVIVNDRADKEATEQLTITSKTVLINSSNDDSGGTDVSDYGRAGVEDRRSFFFRTNETAPASSVYFEPEVIATSKISSVSQTTAEIPSTNTQPETTTQESPMTSTASSMIPPIPPRYFEVFNYPSSSTTESPESTTIPNSTPSVYFEPEISTVKTSTAITTTASNPDVIWYGEWVTADEAHENDDETSQPQDKVTYLDDVDTSSTSKSLPSTTTATWTSTTTVTTTTKPSPQEKSQGISTETQVRFSHICLINLIRKWGTYVNEGDLFNLSNTLIVMVMRFAHRLRYLLALMEIGNFYAILRGS